MGIGRKFQTPSVYRSLTCFENLEVALGFRRSRTGAVQGLGDAGDARALATRSRRSGLAQRG